MRASRTMIELDRGRALTPARGVQNVCPWPTLVSNPAGQLAWGSIDSHIVVGGPW